jgi:hypothetical protein
MRPKHQRCGYEPHKIEDSRNDGSLLLLIETNSIADASRSKTPGGVAAWSLLNARPTQFGTQLSCKEFSKNTLNADPYIGCQP